jgi:mannose-6-phosphate isomerase-like protein (cupin superfamily)
MDEKELKITGTNERQVTRGEIVGKPWGTEKIEYSSEGLMVKKLTMDKGCLCSVQLHQIKREVASVLSGALDYVMVRNEILDVPEAERSMEKIQQLIERRLVLKVGDMVVVEPGTIHYMAAPNEQAVYREVSLGPNETTRVFDPNAHLRKDKDLTK